MLATQLGLGHITDEQIMQRVWEAEHNENHEVKFKVDGHTVKIKVSVVETKGIIR